ncbi:MAG TPA: chitinase [Dysgonomonas sp.]|nr:chitinase [Dysgonomonas sp.]
MISDQQLKCIYPRSSVQNRNKYLPFINQYSGLYGVDTYERMCAFLAQVGHESGQLRYVEELASGEAYEGRKDLGNVRTGDGLRYKGRGLIQITGRENYTKLEKEWGIDLLNNPRLLCEPEYAVLSAYWYWKDRRLNRYATLDESDFRKLTKLINGGYNGYADRLAIWNRAKEELMNNQF